MRILIENHQAATLKTAHDWPGTLKWEQLDGQEFVDLQGNGHVCTATPKQKYGTARLRVSFFPPGQSDTPCFTEKWSVVLAQTVPSPPVNAALVIG